MMKEYRREANKKKENEIEREDKQGVNESECEKKNEEERCDIRTPGDVFQ